MAEDAVGDGARYWAFISYSHKDAAFGRRLHRRLENYALPRRLAGRATSRGIVPRRLTPIFRDREELPAAHDLSVEVRAALAASRSLIVVCSPSAAASPWVSREVELFRALHPDRPILAALAKGEPGESFPSALHGTLADGTTIEPLAADFRREGDGAQAALLKLVAGIAGIGLDELVQRDAQRNLQRVTAVTATALLAMLVMGLLTIFALGARSEAELERKEAELQRGKAEAQVSFMINGLRTKLVEVDRLDILAAVNKQALDYFTGQDLSQLSPASLSLRAKTLDEMGADDEDRGDFNTALNVIKEAGRTTAALLADSPNDPARIYNHAQSEFWIGTVAYNTAHYDEALPSFEAYERLTDRLFALAPDNPVYLKEVGYAEGNICAVELKKKSTSPQALPICISALKHIEHAAAVLPPSSEITGDVANRHAWLADAYRSNDDIARAKPERLIAESMLEKQMDRDPKNLDLKEAWVRDQIGLASIDRAAGQYDDGLARLQRAKAQIELMIKFDPTHHDWIRTRDNIDGAIGRMPQPKI